jgi:hypothetical protein
VRELGGDKRKIKRVEGGWGVKIGVWELRGDRS